jgi:hypothetical protein
MGEQADSHARLRGNPDARALEPRTWVRPPDMPDMAPVSQLAIAYPFVAALWLVGVMSASPGYEFLGTVIFLMIGPTFIMGVAVATGLPVRLNRRLSRWWLGNWPVYLLIGAAGAGLLIAGFNTPERQTRNRRRLGKGPRATRSARNRDSKTPTGSASSHHRRHLKHWAPFRVSATAARA